MKRSRLPLLLLPLLLAVPLWIVKEKRENSTEVILSRYEETSDKNFLAVTSNHRDMNRLDFYKPLELAATWFIKSNLKTATSSFVNRLGQVMVAKQDQGGPDVFTKIRPLSSAQLKDLRLAISQLPPNDAPKSPNQLLIVTFKRANQFETRLYNRAHLPQGVMDIFKITGAPLEELRP